MYKQNNSLQKFAVLVDMFKALAPYTRSLLEENRMDGIALQRPLFFHYESDPTSFTIGYEYLYGGDLLVAPVLKPGARSWSVYLPKDDWVYLYDGTQYDGGKWIIVPAPLGKPPVFYKQSSAYIDIFKKVTEIVNNAKDTCINDNC